MHQVFWLRPRTLAGRTGPDRDAWNPEELAHGGIGAVLSVNDGELVCPEDLAEAGISHHCVPFSDNAPPQPGDFDTCVSALPKALAFTTTAIESGRGVLVHCHSGKDRTGLFLAYYLCQIEDLPPIEAIAEVRRVRPIALSAEGWGPFALRVLDALDA